MHDANITIDSINKIEGTAGLSVTIKDSRVIDLKFMIKDYRRFYTDAVKGKPIIATPSFLSRICGTCSVAHLFCALEAIEKSQNIIISDQTKLIRRLAYNGLILRDHALHLYFFVLPDILGIDSILDISDDPDDPAHILLHDSFDIKKIGADITNITIGAAIHAPFPIIGGFIKLPDETKFAELADRLEKIRPQILRCIKTFYDWEQSLVRNTDYLCLQNSDRFDFLEGEVINSQGKKVKENEFLNFLTKTVIPYSQSEGYLFSEDYEDYLVGALARINLNGKLLNARTRTDAGKYLSVFPSDNIYHNNLAQAIELLQCADDAIELLKSLKIKPEIPIKQPVSSGVGVGVIEAPRGILYHEVEVNEKGMITNYDVIVPTAQNQINIENDLKEYFNRNLDKDEVILKQEAEKIIRAYDPCMSCATNFLKMDLKRL